ECREAFSARVDDALSADARAALEQHLAGCPECRREWQRFAATVDLLHVVPPERAPAGFVDRVLAAARPQPWYRRALRGLFVPWPIKLSLEAAALVLVAGLAVMIFQRSTELRQAAVSPPAQAPAKQGHRRRRARRQQQVAEPQPAPRPGIEDKAAAPGEAYAEKRAETRGKLAPAAKAAPAPPAAAGAAAPSKDAERDVGS